MSTNQTTTGTRNTQREVKAMSTRLRLVHPHRGPVASTTGPAGVPELSEAQSVEVCARQADALAGQAEHATRLVLALIEDLGAGDLLGAHRAGFGLHATLRVLSGSLGELHTVLDELANGGGLGGAS